MVEYRDDWDCPTQITYDGSGNYWARFRANSEKVRVSIRPYLSNQWFVQVKCRETGRLYSNIHMDPKVAIQEALWEAYSDGMGGIDIALEWVYRHPWGHVV